MMATPLQAQADCKFSLVTERPKDIRVDGGTEIVQSIKVVDQADSPVVLTALDVRGLTVGASPSGYAIEGTISVEVMNISDLPISRVEIGRAAVWQDGFSSGRWSFGTTLSPGARGVLTFNVAMNLP